MNTLNFLFITDFSIPSVLYKPPNASSRKFWVPSESKEMDAMSFQNEITALLAETERWLNHLKQRI
ncbi:hypothetical protein ACSLOR_29240, partial [Klebsiella pneumoniae]|uniref:hypothetical protein n=1 Tax=Klebsiella pneumoniae TaxID=573 RepID=UPI003EE3B175